MQKEKEWKGIRVTLRRFGVFVTLYAIFLGITFTENKSKDDYISRKQIVSSHRTRFKK